MMIPEPSSLSEVAELRKNEDMISFRNVYSQWISYLRDGDIPAFYKMWRDVLKAKEALDKITKFKKVDGSILTRGLFVAAGEIPIVSELISGYGFISATMVDDIEKRNRWCNLPALSNALGPFIR